MKIHYLQHETFETPGAILNWAHGHHHTLTSSMVWKNGPLPDPDSFDMLVIMGGSMSVGDEHLHPWMPAETLCIKKAIDAGKAVLGICLGAQLIAHALGAKVYKSNHREIGWFPVYLTPEGASSRHFLAWPETADMFHWHGDTFDIPDGAVRLAETNGCPNQAFSYGKNTLALQFHPEITESDLDEFLEVAGAECAIKGRYVQTLGFVESQKHVIPEMNGLLYSMLDSMVKPVN